MRRTPLLEIIPHLRSLAARSWAYSSPALLDSVSWVPPRWIDSEISIRPEWAAQGFPVAEGHPTLPRWPAVSWFFYVTRNVAFPKE